ncbi:hypothetical protein [Aquimarina algiphila]|uniref:Uncharacterized protein n=1 Tax=Aquimarina algiphila TaxID=2047982 RepID=A0A554VMB8_9FLAO|nr:hypothetical protein [Aquimarina algiphila]TSE09355.1 hypothetical protein FOF46_08865 [Aquimarina algiphila]
MKKATGKKLTLEKLNITKLEQMSSINGGHGKSGRPDCQGVIFYYLHTFAPGCPTKTHTAGNTILGG